MVITSLSPYTNAPSKRQNYKKDWNRSEKGTQHFCTCYIRSDMLGVPEIKSLCYGFFELSEDSLIAIGSHDIGSNTSKKFLSNSGWSNEYVPPNELINTTSNEKLGWEKGKDYNELDYKRFQNGERKQPDYIVAFMVNGVIANMDCIRQAVSDWGQELPVVVIDVNECIKEQKRQLDELYNQFYETKSSQIAEQIIQKERNNSITSNRFGRLNEKINVNEEIKRWFEEHGHEKSTERQVNMEELRINHEGITAQERSEGISAIRKLRERIKEIVNRGNGEGVEI